MTHFKMALASNEQTSITFWKGSNFYNKSLKENKHVVAPILRVNLMNNSTNLYFGSICSLTPTRSLSVNCLQRLSREYMHTERGCEDVTKSSSNITLFLRASSSCTQKWIFHLRKTLRGWKGEDRGVLI